MASNLTSHKEFLAATRRAERKQATIPMVVAARYNMQAHRVLITLSTRIEVMFNPSDVQGLEDATPAQLAEIEITPSGFGLFFPKLDEGINVPNLLEGTMGSRKWDGRAPRFGRRQSPHRRQAHRRPRQRSPRRPPPQVRHTLILVSGISGLSRA